MNDAFLHMDFYVKRHLVEQIMTLVGRGLPNARKYRSDLESMSLAEVRREMELIVSQYEE